MLYVECFSDEKVAVTLGIVRREIRHEKGKGNILNRLGRNIEGTGMVDQDPQATQPNELKNYKKSATFGSLILMEHLKNPNLRLVIICPRLEDWLLGRAEACSLKPADFGLPNSPAQLHGTPRYDQKPKFSEFLDQLKKRDSEVKHLENWISAKPK